MRDAFKYLNLKDSPAAGGADLVAYEEARRRAAAKGAIPQAQVAGGFRLVDQSEAVRDNVKEKLLRDRFIRAMDLGKAKSSDDGETFTLFSGGKVYAYSPDMGDETQVEKLEFEQALPIARELLGAAADPHEAALLIAKAKDKYGSIDPMKLRQVLRYANDEAEVELPQKGQR